MILKDFVVYLGMQERQANPTVLINTLFDKVAVLETQLAEKESLISEQNSTISNLTSDLEEARFQVEQFRRMIFGSKRERFVPAVDSQQLAIEFEPKVAEIEVAVEEEREVIRKKYLAKKPRRNTLGAPHCHQTSQWLKLWWNPKKRPIVKIGPFRILQKPFVQRACR